MDNVPSMQELLKKVEECKKGVVDLSSDEDLSVAIMNLISIEEHFFFTGAKTGKPEYFDLLNTARSIRKDLLGKIVKNPEGEVWCISKHLLATSMRLMEVGTKQQAQGNKQEAAELFNKAYQLYALFWGLNLKLIAIGPVKALNENALNNKDTDKQSLLDKLGSVVKKVINCCIE